MYKGFVLFGVHFTPEDRKKVYSNKRYELLQISARVNSTPDYAAVGTPLISRVLKTQYDIIVLILSALKHGWREEYLTWLYR